MELKMVLAGNIIDSIPIDFEKIGVTGYLEQMRSEIMQRNPDFDCSLREVHFYVDNVPSLINNMRHLS